MVNKPRKTLTLGWSNGNKGERRAPSVDDYVEVPHEAPELRAENKVVPVDGFEDELRLQLRLENWRRTMISARAGSGSCCAAWAALYVASRVRDGNGDAPPGPPREIVAVDQLDGWLVEAAVRMLPVFEERRALQLHYVWQYPEHWIKTKLKLRRTGLRLVLARAKRNLQQLLAQLENPAKILSNNLHAGVDPRPESTDAHVGATLTLKNPEALVD